MTEQEWLTAPGPAPVLEFVWGRASRRKRLLAAGGIARRVWDRLAVDDREWVRAAEDHADGKATGKRLRNVARHRPVSICLEDPGVESSTGVIQTADYCASLDVLPRILPDLREQMGQAAVLRDVFGNPFRPVALDPSWLAPTVLSLAEAIYSGRAFDRLPVLADALEEAGCDNTDILTHSRGDGPHCRGCWVVDLVLGQN